MDQEALICHGLVSVWQLSGRVFQFHPPHP